MQRFTLTAAAILAVMGSSALAQTSAVPPPGGFTQAEVRNDLARAGDEWKALLGDDSDSFRLSAQRAASPVASAQSALRDIRSEIHALIGEESNSIALSENEKGAMHRTRLL